MSHQVLNLEGTLESSSQHLYIKDEKNETKNIFLMLSYLYFSSLGIFFCLIVLCPSLFCHIEFSSKSNETFHICKEGRKCIEKKMKDFDSTDFLLAILFFTSHPKRMALYWTYYVRHRT